MMVQADPVAPGGASPWGWHLQFSQGEAGSLLYVHGPCQALISGLQNSGAPDTSTGPRLQKDHVERPGVRPPSSELGRSPGPFLYLSECQRLLGFLLGQKTVPVSWVHVPGVFSPGRICECSSGAAAPGVLTC